ncbi:MAG: type II secretion system GspH family protein [Clostridiaceae bacterium]|jgi:prepilin-type N-terminal cleavage/methylation domain-containing protein|nr:type II secretion system GspH family protein [Clostridiaceae bacterium]
MKLRQGFTLAEVLITLGIIGIVAALTMPMLIGNYKKQVAATQLKKMVSTLSQALERAKADGKYLDPETETEDDLVDYIIPYFNVAKRCENGEDGCGLTDFKCLHGYDQGLALSKSKKRYVLTDGTFIGFNLIGGTDNYVYVDINGGKKPNKIGYDVFMIHLKLNKNNIKDLVTIDNWGTWKSAMHYFEDDGQGCDKDNTLSGKYCFMRVEYDNYTFDYWK